MKAECGDNTLSITLSKGVVFHTTPTLLSSIHEHRVIPFTMIKEKRGNWREVKDWFKKTLDWSMEWVNTDPINIEKELNLIGRFKAQSFNPEKQYRAKKEVKQEV